MHVDLQGYRGGLDFSADGAVGSGCLSRGEDGVLVILLVLVVEKRCGSLPEILKLQEVGHGQDSTSFTLPLAVVPLEEVVAITNLNGQSQKHHHPNTLTANVSSDKHKAFATKAAINEKQ